MFDRHTHIELHLHGSSPARRGSRWPAVLAVVASIATVVTAVPVVGSILKPSHTNTERVVVAPVVLIVIVLDDDDRLTPFPRGPYGAP